MEKIFRSSLYLASSFFLLCLTVSCSQPKALVSEINWERFMAHQDLDFKGIPQSWQEAPYFGNGFIGSMIYQDTAKNNAIKLQVFRTDVQDHRGDSAGWTAYSRPRLMIGYFEIAFEGEIIEADFKQHLYSADLNANITTTKGKVKLHHFIAANHDRIYTKISMDDSGKDNNVAGLTPSNKSESYTMTWFPAEAKSTRAYLFPDSSSVIPEYAKTYGIKYDTLLKVYEPNPDPYRIEKNGVEVSVQNLLAGGQYAVAWKKVHQQDKSTIIAMTVKNSFPDASAKEDAIKTIAFTTTDYNNDLEETKEWWSKFYQKSFVSLPNKELEALYWLQMYKIGAANRPDGPMMDTAGPWFQNTTWPYITWDLNVQLCYWPLNTSNHLDLGQNLPNQLQKNTDQLIENVKPVEWQDDAAYIALATAQDFKGSKDDDQRYSNLHSNLPWVMHNIWLQYRHTMDEEFLREKCYPLLKRGANYYLHLIEKNADGKYHIPIGYSPEYPEKNLGRPGESKDTNIDLALLKWNLSTLIEASTILNTDGELRSGWQEVLGTMAEYPVNQNGYMVGADLPFTESHRHYSHLLMMYPLYLVNIENQPDIDLMAKSLKHWIGNPDKLAGYSYTGAASLSAAMGNGNEALTYLKGLQRFLTSNGLYQEGGRPVLETPLSAAQSIHDMLLQSWGNKIRFFPALPDAWNEVTFHNWLTEGAFEVSAVLKNSETDFLTIKSLVGSPCTFISTIENPVATINDRIIKLNKVGEDTYQLDLRKNETVIIRSADYHGALIINEIKKQNS